MSWEISSSDLLAAVGITSPSAADTAWATKCVDAVNAAYTTRLNGTTIASPSDAEDELTRAAYLDAIQAWKDRDNPYGVLGFGPDGDSIRVGFDVIRHGHPVISRYALPGIG